MYLLRFPQHPGCCLFSKYSAGEADNFLVVLDEIISLFDIFMPAREEIPFQVRLVRGEGSPCCFRGKREIYLNTDISYVAQAAYQFSHELCHYRISYLVADDLRWLEESICETASHFYMRKLSHVLSGKEKYPLLKAYAPRFIDFSERILEESREIDLRSPLQLRRLKLNWYLREENRCVAGRLLPLVSSRPIFWQAVPYLGDIPPGFTLSDSFAIWKKIAPAASRQTLEELRGIFCQE